MALLRVAEWVSHSTGAAAVVSPAPVTIGGGGGGNEGGAGGQSCGDIGGAGSETAAEAGQAAESCKSTSVLCLITGIQSSKLPPAQSFLARQYLAGPLAKAGFTVRQCQ